MKKFWGWVWAAMKLVFEALWWVTYELSGLRWVCEHVRPPSEEEKKKGRPAPTITIWVVGVYTALFGLASARYEHAVDRVETRAGAVIALLANDKIRSDATAQVALIQNREVPKRPEYGTFFIYSFWEWEPYEEGMEMLKTAIESCKKELSGANLYRANLQTANLKGANLKGAELGEANLLEANLQGANLESSNLLFADLRRAFLEGANLQGANLALAYLGRANLQGTKLEGAYLESANLEGANLAGADLKDIQNWKGIWPFEGANITGVKNAPDGFVQWALANGAVDDNAKEKKNP